MKGIDEPTGRIGVILRRARTTCNMSQDADAGAGKYLQAAA